MERRNAFEMSREYHDTFVRQTCWNVSSTIRSFPFMKHEESIMYNDEETKMRAMNIIDRVIIKIADMQNIKTNFEIMFRCGS